MGEPLEFEKQASKQPVFLKQLALLESMLTRVTVGRQWDGLSGHGIFKKNAAST